MTDSLTRLRKTDDQSLISPVTYSMTISPKHLRPRLLLVRDPHNIISITNQNDVLNENQANF